MTHLSQLLAALALAAIAAQASAQAGAPPGATAGPLLFTLGPGICRSGPPIASSAADGKLAAAGRAATARSGLLQNGAARRIPLAYGSAASTPVPGDPLILCPIRQI